MKGIAWEWTLDTARSAKAAAGNAGETSDGTKHSDPPEECRIWRPVISRRSRERARALCDKATALFTDKFKS